MPVRYLLLFCFILVAVVPLPLGAAEDDAPPPIQENDILTYLEKAITWNRALSGIELPDNARQAVLKNSVHLNSTKALQKSFDFAQNESSILSVDAAAKPGVQAGNQGSRMAETAAENKRHIEDLQTSLQQLKIGPGGRNALMARKERLESELNLAKARQELLETIRGNFSDSEEADSASLSSKISNLARSLPANIEQKSVAKTEPEKTTSSPNLLLPVIPSATLAETEKGKTSSGIFGLIGDIFSISRRQKELSDLIKQTDEIRANNHALSQSLRSELKRTLAEGNEMAAKEEAGGSDNLAANHAATNEILNRYRGLGAAIIPLSQAGLLIDNSARDLKDWSKLIDAEMSALLQKLLFRLVILTVSILIPIILSNLAHRAIIRYVQDPRRQKQLRILRQVIFGFVLVLVLILNFVTEFGSLATFAGFLTAGLAVALQTVLLSLVAHFFFFGRFGVRVGDRVTITGTTGEVIQVGMLRIYLMELVGKETELRPSGKIVAFPNSILFNPTAFFKQIPGADYIWNEMDFLLGADIDYQLAGEKIMEAVDAVYSDYKEAIEHQHNVLQQSTRLSVKMPMPKGELRYTENGLAYVVRYPVVIKKVYEMQERITRKLIKIFKDEPKLKFISSKPLRIEAAS